MSIMGTLPALVMKNTGKFFCFRERRMQISGVNDERMIFLLGFEYW